MSIRSIRITQETKRKTLKKKTSRESSRVKVSEQQADGANNHRTSLLESSHRKDVRVGREIISTSILMNVCRILI